LDREKLPVGSRSFPHFLMTSLRFWNTQSHDFARLAQAPCKTLFLEGVRDGTFGGTEPGPIPGEVGKSLRDGQLTAGVATFAIGVSLVVVVRSEDRFIARCTCGELCCRQSVDGDGGSPLLLVLALLTFLASEGGPGVVDQDEAFEYNVGVGGSTVVEEIETPLGEGVAFVACSRAAHDPGTGVVRKGVA
jgi:hypothetical protein